MSFISCITSVSHLFADRCANTQQVRWYLTSFATASDAFGILFSLIKNDLSARS